MKLRCLSQSVTKKSKKYYICILRKACSSSFLSVSSPQVIPSASWKTGEETWRLASLKSSGSSHCQISAALCLRHFLLQPASQSPTHVLTISTTASPFSQELSRTVLPCSNPPKKWPWRSALSSFLHCFLPLLAPIDTTWNQSSFSSLLKGKPTAHPYWQLNSQSSGHPSSSIYSPLCPSTQTGADQSVLPSSSHLLLSSPPTIWTLLWPLLHT